MLTFLLHRITALGIITFVGLHILASFFMQQLVADQLGTAINIIYEAWWFQIFVVFCVIFHTFNGLRITILDIFPKLLKFQREAIWLEWAIVIPLYGLTVFMLFYTGLIGG